MGTVVDYDNAICTPKHVFPSWMNNLVLDLDIGKYRLGLELPSPLLLRLSECCGVKDEEVPCPGTPTETRPDGRVTSSAQ